MSNTSFQTKTSQAENLDWDLDLDLDHALEFQDEPPPEESNGLDFVEPALGEAVAPRDNFVAPDAKITVDQIRALESRGQALKAGASNDPNLLKVLEDLSAAELDEREALRQETFHDSAHQGKAAQLYEIAAQLYGSASSYIEGMEKKGPTVVEGALSEDEKELSAKIGNKLGQAANKIGYVHYNFREETNDTATAFCILLGGLISPTNAEFKDYYVKSTVNSAYTVGYYNLDKHEFGGKSGWGSDSGNASHGDHSHGWGDEIADKATYDNLEKQGKGEAGDAKEVLRIVGKALKEEDPEKRKEAWSQASECMQGWNTKNQDRGTLYNRAQLVFNAMLGEVGEADLKKAIELKLIPEEFSGQLSGMLESLPKEIADQKDKSTDNHYFRGGASDQNWSNTKCADFFKGVPDLDGSTEIEEDNSEASEEDLKGSKAGA